MADDSATSSAQRQELEEQYSPSRWSRRGDADYVISEHVRFAKEESERVRAQLPPLETARVGPGPRQLVDLFVGPQLPADCPVLVYVHGGYWQELSRELSAYCVRPLHGAGIAVAVVGYDLAPQVNVSDIVEQVQAAVEFVLNFAKKRGSSAVWVCGHSAGAHLSACLLSPWLDRLDAAARRLLRGLVLASGVYRLAPLVPTYVNHALRLTREAADSVSPALAAFDLSPDSKDSIKNMRILVAIGQHDSPAFHEQSREYSKILRGICDHVEYLEVADMDHFSVVENLHEEDYILTKKIIEMIKSSNN
ncbi:kynurenine formamidase [Schistocerca gregaria]|uniref:kynurenine formamidase n=1 Tax=Schistocerca gregaria TaxID=7010 RepID=UPI00211E4926|nr:kynurenine formamidase [Schistocerca gregaria]